MLAEPTFNPREARERTLEVCRAASLLDLQLRKTFAHPCAMESRPRSRVLPSGQKNAQPCQWGPSPEYIVCWSTVHGSESLF